MPPRKHLSIDFAFDEPSPAPRVGTDILQLAMILTRLFYTEDALRNLTDCSWDNFMTIVDRMEPSSVLGDIDLEDYINEVLTWAFASCGRQG